MRAKKLRMVLGMSGLVVSCLAIGVGGWYWHGAFGAKSAAQATDNSLVEAEVILDQEQREYIWQIEHHV